jgi:hypothetical protein
MKRLNLIWLSATVCIIGLGFLLTFFYFSYSEKIKDSNNILAVWKQLNAADETAKFRKKNGREEFSVMKFANSVARIDCSACPPDFQVPFTRLVESSKQLANQMRAQDQAVLEKLIQSAMQFDPHIHALKIIFKLVGVSHHKIAVQSHINEESADFKNAIAECKQVASQYGITFANDANP